MLSSMLQSRPSWNRNKDHSPYSSFHGNPSSPDEPRRHRPEIRHAAAAYTETEDDEQETERNGEHEVGGDEEEEDMDHEDGHLEHDDEDEDPRAGTPLLPIFSAAHLGRTIFLLTIFHISPTTKADLFNRCLASLQPYPCDSTDRGTTMRNHVNMGPTSITTSLTIPCEADATDDSNLSFLSRHTICADGKLLAI